MLPLMSEGVWGVGWPMLQLLVNHSYIITVTHVTVKIEPTLELSGEIYEALQAKDTDVSTGRTA